MVEYTVDVFYGGHFLCENNGGKVSYLGGSQHQMRIHLSSFVLIGLQDAIQELLVNRKVVKVHFWKPKKPLSIGLMLLYEGTSNTFTELLKKYKKN